MRPTPLAESLANPIGDALATLRAGLKADEDFDVRTAQRHFRLILHDFSVPVILPPLLELFDRPDSSSKIEVVTPDWAKPHDALRSGEVDISVDIYPIETPGVNCVPLTKVMPVCIAREGHPTIAQSISRDQFMAAGHVVLGHNAQARIQVASVLLAAGVARREVCLVPNAADLATVVATTDLIAMVPERYGMRVAPIHRLQLVPLPFDFPAITLFISCREDKLAEPGLQWIRNAIMDILDE